MAEKQGQRENIEKMAEQLRENSQNRVSREKAYEIARKAAIRNDQKKDK